MAQASIPVDLFNPGQVFACLGFLEAADILLGNAQGSFEWAQSGDFFKLRANGDTNPVQAVLSFLRTADVKWFSPCDDLKERDGGETEVLPGLAASGDPKSSDLPGVFRGQHGSVEREIPFGYWADGSGRFATTFKKSTNGASSHIRLKNALDAIRRLNRAQAESDPLNQDARTESLFRLDPRGSVDPIHGGFSPDTLRKGAKGGLDMRVATYPLCELLAILGLEHARPERLDSNHFAYNVWDRVLPPMLARAAIGGCLVYGRVRRFVVEHVEVTKMGDRKMSHITEELTT
ncbi:type I-G CRISPR-associated protein Cas8g2 [Candidatus Nitrospira bockiana]